jgi:hypothetical protein
MATRGFSMGGEVSPPERNIDKDAPQGMRQEILDVAFSIAEHNTDARLTPDLIYRVISQTLGIAPSGNPYGGFRYAAGRDLSRAPWPRVYDIILRLAREFDLKRYAEFQHGINQALAGNGGRLGPVGRPPSCSCAALACPTPSERRVTRTFRIAIRPCPQAVHCGHGRLR